MYQPAYGPPRARDHGRMAGASPGLVPNLGRPGHGPRDHTFGGGRDARLEADYSSIPGACPPREQFYHDYRTPMYHDRQQPVDYRAPMHSDPWGQRRPEIVGSRDRPLYRDLYSDPAASRVPIPMQLDRFDREAEMAFGLGPRPGPLPRDVYPATYDEFPRPNADHRFDRGDPPPARQNFGARAWGERSPLQQEEYFEQPSYGLRPPQGLQIPGFDLPRHPLPAERQQDVRSWQDRFGTAPGAVPKPPVEVDTPVVPPSGNGLMPNLGAHGKGATAPDLPEVIPLGDGPLSNESTTATPLPTEDQVSAAMSQLRQIEAQVEVASRELHLTQQALKLAQVTPGQAKTDLAQLEARLERLQCNGIDSVSTAGLSSQDEDAARSLRRQLTKQVEQLQSSLDDTFDRLKAER